MVKVRYSPDDPTYHPPPAAFSSPRTSGMNRRGAAQPAHHLSKFFFGYPVPALEGRKCHLISGIGQNASSLGGSFELDHAVFGTVGDENPQTIRTINFVLLQTLCFEPPAETYHTVEYFVMPYTDSVRVCSSLGETE